MAKFKKAAAAGEIADGEGRCVTLEGKTLALFNIGGEYYAIDDMCPHRGGSLGNGTVEGEWVTCPMHEWKFNIKTGQLPMGGGVVSYPTRVEDGEVFVEF